MKASKPFTAIAPGYLIKYFTGDGCDYRSDGHYPIAPLMVYADFESAKLCAILNQLQINAFGVDPQADYCEVMTVSGRHESSEFSTQGWNRACRSGSLHPDKYTLADIAASALVAQPLSALKKAISVGTGLDAMETRDWELIFITQASLDNHAELIVSPVRRAGFYLFPPNADRVLSGGYGPFKGAEETLLNVGMSWRWTVIWRCCWGVAPSQ